MNKAMSCADRRMWERRLSDADFMQNDHLYNVAWDMLGARRRAIELAHARRASGKALRRMLRAADACVAATEAGVTAMREAVGEPVNG